MTFFRQTLESSLLLRPWVAMAETGSFDLARWIRNARAYNAVRDVMLKLGAGHSGLMGYASVFNYILAVGVAGLFILASFGSTGMIGALTLLLFVFVLLGGIFFRPALLNRLNIIDLLVLLFLGSAVLSTAFSSYTHTSIIGLAKMITFIGGYTVFRVLSEQGYKTIAMLMGLLTALGLFETAVGFYQHINHIEPLATWSDTSVNPELQMDRIFGTLKPYNPNLLAGFLTPCFAAAAGISLIFFNRKTWWLSLILMGISVLILVAIVLTGSRGGFLAIAGMLVCMFAYVGHLIWHDEELKQFKWMKPAWLTVLLLSVLGMAGGILSSQKIRTRVASIFAMREDSSISFRLNVYQAAIKMFHDNFLVGIGPGNNTFKLVYGLYMIPGYSALSAYNVLLEIGIEQGIIGLLIFVSILLVLLIRTMLAMDSAAMDLKTKLLCGALLTGIVGSMTYGVFDTILYRPAVNILFWFMVAALARLTEPQDSNAFKGKL